MSARPNTRNEHKVEAEEAMERIGKALDGYYKTGSGETALINLISRIVGECEGSK